MDLTPQATPLVPAQPAAPVAPAPVATSPAPVVTPAPVAPPPPPTPRPAPRNMDNEHSHIGYIVLAIALLLVGLVAGAAGGYYYAVLGEPEVQTPATTDTSVNPAATQTPPTTDTTSTDTTASTTVKVNPFQ